MKIGHSVCCPTAVQTMMRRQYSGFSCCFRSRLVAVNWDREVCGISWSGRSLLHLSDRCLSFLPGAKIEIAHVDLKVVDIAALGSTVLSDGLTASCLRLKCGAPLVVSAFLLPPYFSCPNAARGHR